MTNNDLPLDTPINQIPAIMNAPDFDLFNDDDDDDDSDAMINFLNILDDDHPTLDDLCAMRDILIKTIAEQMP